MNKIKIAVVQKFEGAVDFWMKLEREVKLKIIQMTAVGVVLFLGGCMFGRWQGGRYFDDQLQLIPRAVAMNNGQTIRIPKESPSRELIQTSSTARGGATLRVTAPARVVAVASTSPRQGEHIILFDSPDTTSLYSQYRQAKANFQRSSRNYERTKDMYQNEAATAKELNDAEGEMSAAKTVLIENEVKLRTSGYDPESLEKLKPKTAWLISDIPEAQIKEVQIGEDVKVEFASMPDLKVVGKADSIGDAIDPVTRTIKVKVVLSNAKGKIMPGMFAKADFGAYENGTIVIPVSALVSVEEKNYVFVASSDEEFQRRSVLIAPMHGDSVVVTSGLKNGEKVVSRGAMLLKGLSFAF